MDIKSLEAELLKLSPKELLESLESDENEDIDEIWVNEALNRYYQITGSNKNLIDSELVIREAKSKYK